MPKKQDVRPATKDEACDVCGYPFDTHQLVFLDGDGNDHPFCSVKCIRERAIGLAELERQQFSADMNEWYGRGNHPF